TVIRQGPLPETLAKIVKRHRIQRLGFQPEYLTVDTLAKLRRVLRSTRMVALPSVVGQLRLIKDDSEVTAIKKAIRVAESAFRAVLRRIRLGMTERQLAALLQHEMLDRGAEEASFPIIVAAGANSSRPHAQPGDRKIRTSDAVLIDWGAKVDRYCSDLTRVIFIRRIPPRFKRIYENVLEAQKKAIQAIRPGIRMCDVDAIARKALKRARMDKWFAHGLGHGLGIDIHEPPQLAKTVTEPLQKGMVVTVEPGVYRAGMGGIRIEDDILVTEKGCRVLSSLTKDLDRMVV
ncbi:MAG: aminopeptidase P family protein, partial [Planctomycetota bacterium]